MPSSILAGVHPTNAQSIIFIGPQVHQCSICRNTEFSFDKELELSPATIITMNATQIVWFCCFFCKIICAISIIHVKRSYPTRQKCSIIKNMTFTICCFSSGFNLTLKTHSSEKFPNSWVVAINFIYSKIVVILYKLFLKKSRFHQFDCHWSKILLSLFFINRWSINNFMKTYFDNKISIPSLYKLWWTSLSE